jgi:hypothetical protein
MKKPRAIRAIEFLDKAPNKTLTLFELNALMGTDWSPRAINEARKLGAVIQGDNPYTLLSQQVLPKKPIRWEFNNETNTAIPIYA